MNNAQHVRFSEELEREFSRLILDHKMSKNGLIQSPIMQSDHYRPIMNGHRLSEDRKRQPPGLSMDHVHKSIVTNNNDQMMRLRTYSMSSTGSSGGKSTEGSSSPIIGDCITSCSSGQLSSGTDSGHLLSGHESGSSSQTSSPDLSKYQDMTCIKKLFFGENIPLLRIRERSNSGTIFNHRRDFSSFNVLPGTKINSYHIKMEDESSHGNDDIRNFILSSLSTHRINRIQCILCQEYMQVYDKYPLIDGTFFLSPRQHSSNGSSVPVILKSPILSSMSLLSNNNDVQSTESSRKSSISKNGQGSKNNGRNQNSSGQKSRSNSKSCPSSKHGQSSCKNSSESGCENSSGSGRSGSGSMNEGNKQYLQAVCMSCLEGWSFKIACRSCHRPWIGSNLTLGSMYSYDIFAALPCCISRYSCNACSTPIMSPDRRLQFFSDYSQNIPCPNCSLRDHHFVKPLGITFMRSLHPPHSRK